MISLPGYNIIRKLWTGNRRSFYVGERKKDATPIIIKTHFTEAETFKDQARLKHEFEILENLKCNGVPIPYALEACPNGFALILEHIDGISLLEFINKRKIDLSVFLKIAISITEVLGELHQNHIIHKDIQPENIFINPQTHQIWIMDFRLATALPKEKPKSLKPGAIEGSLAHISPEQTGRMNRTVDYRTDFYSLGVLLYQMLTGRLPFKGADPLKLVHSHLAKQPLPPHEIDSQIPGAVSEIIIKLLSKNPGERYLSARGLLEDLNVCLQQLEKKGDVELFVLGEKDFSEKLQISQKLYGRDQEIDILLETFEKASIEGTQIAVVSGYPGIGKTSIVQEIQIPIIQKNGLFITGKFDPFHKNIPYSALLRAFQQLIRQLLTEREDQLEQWKRRLLSSLGNYGQLFINAIPELELIIGKQPPVKAMDSNEYKNLVNRLKIDFIRAFSNPEQPLVIFLDDLQWVDTSTLRLIDQLATEARIQHLFLIISYRDNEVSPSHPLTTTLEKIQKAKSPLVRLPLNTLKLQDIKHLMADTLRASQKSVSALADLVDQKTDGNPFFVIQFLQTLFQENLLVLNTDDGLWEWDLQAITKLDFTDNVVELLTQRLALMPEDTRHLMMMAACIGSRFDIKTLRTITSYTESDIIRFLFFPIRQDLLIAYTDSEDEASASVPHAFMFRHDRIRQASYALISEKNKKSTHRKIGQLLLDNIDSFQKDEKIIAIIHHLNISAGLIRKQQERDEIAELNLVAGIRSMALAAFEQAYNYFSMGIKMLGPKCWKRQYNLSLQLYSRCVEAARLCGNTMDMEKLFNLVIKNARSKLDQVSVYQSRIMSLISEDRRFKALDMALEMLKELGVLLPSRPTQKEMQSMLMKTISELPEGDIKNLINMPEMEDPQKLAAMKLIGAVYAAAYQLNRELYVMLICQGAKLSIRHGNIANSAIAYCGFGSILCGYTGNIDIGYKLGRLGLELIKLFGAKELKAKTDLLFYAAVHHWKFHLRETIEPLAAAFISGKEVGDFEYAIYNLFFSNVYAFIAGESLPELEKKLYYAKEVADQMNQIQFLPYITVTHQTVLNLIEKKDNTFDLMGNIHDNSTIILTPQDAGDKAVMFFLHYYKMMLCYLFGLFNDAVAHADQAKELIQFAIGQVTTPSCLFFDSLCRLAAYETCPDKKQKQIISLVIDNQQKMKTWADHAPMNHEHQFFLVEAELSRIQNKHDDTARCFNYAIRFARENKYYNDEALANELMAQYWLSREHYEFAEVFMTRAYAGYIKWGAVRKADHLIEQYPHITKYAPTGSNATSNSVVQNKDHPAEYFQDKLDIATLMKSSHAIFSETALDNLLTTMMRIVIENTGAEKGFLLLNTEGKLMISAAGHIEEEKILVRAGVGNHMETENLPMAAIQYVARTNEFMVLENASTDDRFKNDPYFRKHHLKSVLCIPIMHKSNLTGIIYLENKMAPDVFSSERIKLLKLLTSQIAISIENTRLFEKHKKAEEKYRGIFENALEGIFLSSIDGHFLSVNPAMVQILGYDSPEELLEKIIDITNQVYASPSSREKFLRIMQKNERIKNFETQFCKKDGTLIWVSVNARSIFDANGKLSLLEGFIVDITERKAATDALRQREESLRKENVRLRADIKDRYKFGNIIGKSAGMQKVYELILKAAATNAAVIIYGESGTGKELVAKAIHEASDRKEGNFVPVNCGAIPENLLESEFFGYKKGAFTGAYANKEGFLDLAKKGTLFLDELGEIDLAFQVKLLRALEDGSYTPLGGQTVKKSDARVVAATSRDLQKAIRNGSMREDFFYRIHVIPIHLPPLRERQEDMPLLVEHFLKIHSTTNEMSSVSARVIDDLCSHKWPGNVRELQNVLQRYCTIGTLDFLPNANIKPEIPADKIKSIEANANNTMQDYHETIADTEKKMIIEALEQNKWNRTKAAKQLDINLRSFYRKLKKYEII